MWQVYKYLPLCTVIREAAFVVHGGLLRDAKWTLEHIEQVPKGVFYTTISDLYKGRFPDAGALSAPVRRNSMTAKEDRPPSSSSRSRRNSKTGLERRGSQQLTLLSMENFAQIVEDLTWSDPDPKEPDRRLNSRRKSGSR